MNLRRVFKVLTTTACINSAPNDHTQDDRWQNNHLYSEQKLELLGWNEQERKLNHVVKKVCDHPRGRNVSGLWEVIWQFGKARPDSSEDLVVIRI